MRSRAALAAALALAAMAAHADAPPFRDDRSSPAAIVASLYDALNRQEYARAWSYFGDPKPVADYPAFVKGYETTAAIVLHTGTVTTDGAAGSIYGSVPIAIAATGTDGATHVFAGCYTTRQIQPSVQEPPFRPLEIVSGKLAPTDLPAEAAIPADCPAP